MIAETRACDYRLDLRALAKGWGDFRLAKHGKPHRPWRELVASGLKKVVAGGPALSPTDVRVATRRRELDLARELFERHPAVSDKPARDAAWQEATGKSVDTLYRRHRELAAADVTAEPADE